ncbi:MAG: chemotaxis protein CheW [Planctomycetes bacterium]|nr:chemotaxis protein CheW [Planctomycetota bacterium]
MTTQAQALAGRAAELRRAFDLSFAAPGLAASRDDVAFLAVRAGTGSFALALAEVAGVQVNAIITPLPGAPPDLLGLACVRGTILPVYDLARLLGCPSPTPPRWLAVAAGAGTSPVAFGFHGYEGLARVSRAQVVAEVGGQAPGEPPPPREVLRHGGIARPVVHLAALVAALANSNNGHG